MSAPNEVTGDDFLGIADEQIPLGATIAIDVKTQRARVVRPPCTDPDCLFCFHHGVPVINAIGRKVNAAASSEPESASNPAGRMGTWKVDAQGTERCPECGASKECHEMVCTWRPEGRRTNSDQAHSMFAAPVEAGWLGAEVTNADVPGRGEAARGDAPAVADVGGAAGPGAGPHPAGGDDAGGDAGGAGVGGSNPGLASRMVTTSAPLCTGFPGDWGKPATVEEIGAHKQSCPACARPTSATGGLWNERPEWPEDTDFSPLRPSEASPGAAGWVHRHDTLCPLCGRRSGEHEAQHQIGYMCPEPRAPRPDYASASPDDLRAAGWAVAVHNDYRLDGHAHTFWLVTKEGRAVKGEGRTDAEALDAIRAEVSGQKRGDGT